MPHTVSKKSLDRIADHVQQQEYPALYPLHRRIMNQVLEARRRSIYPIFQLGSRREGRAYALQALQNKEKRIYVRKVRGGGLYILQLIFGPLVFSYCNNRSGSNGDIGRSLSVKLRKHTAL